MEKFKRKKKFNIVNSFFYNLDKFLLLSNTLKLKFYLNLEFIFKRLAHEKSYVKFKNFHPSTQNTIGNLKKFVNKNYNILDIGCGNGYIAYSLANYVKNITCVDYDLNAINYAQKKFSKKNINYICGDIKNIKNLNIKNINLIICSHIIEHLENPFTFLKFLKKFNTPIYIEVPDFENDNLNQVKKILNFDLRYTDADHIYEFDRFALIKKLKLMKFKIINQIYKNGVICLLIK